MAERPRLVVDTNVLVSRLLAPRSVPAEAVRRAADHGVLLLSEPTLAELARVLARPKFDPYVSIADRQQFLRLLGRIAVTVPILHRVQACRDPMDDKFLEVAINGGAALLITGDADLALMRSFRGIPILTPAAYLAALEQTAQ